MVFPNIFYYIGLAIACHSRSSSQFFILMEAQAAGLIPQEPLISTQQRMASPLSYSASLPTQKGNARHCILKLIDNGRFRGLLFHPCFVLFLTGDNPGTNTQVRIMLLPQFLPLPAVRYAGSCGLYSQRRHSNLSRP